MRRSSASIAVVAALSLVALQLSGVHMHIGEHGYVGVPEGPHSHSRMPPGRDVAARHHEGGAHHHEAGELAHEHAHVATDHDHGAPSEAAHGHDHGAHEGALTGRRDAADENPGLPRHDHDYDGTKDVSILELSNGVSKLLLAVFWVAFALPILVLQCTGISPGFWLPVLSGRRSRWRPPLRAPPLAV